VNTKNSRHIYCKYILASLFLFSNSHCMQFARLCNCPQSIKLLEIMPQNIKLLVKSARFATESLYSQNKKPPTQKDERHIFLQDGYACAASAIVQGGDHIDRLIHRVALAADDRAVSDQHVPAARRVEAVFWSSCADKTALLDYISALNKLRSL
jgi:hypothetical protein